MTEPSVTRVTADPALSARVVSRRPLLYTTAGDAAWGRPDHVRAASGIAWLGDRLVVIQDDASFVAVIDADDWSIDAIALPAGVDGARLFDVERGNKKHKLDLEACTTVTRDGVETLLALGSGSSTARENIVLVQARGTVLNAQVISGARLYDTLRAHTTFTSSELNLEGLVLIGDRLRVFQRSNGVAHRDHHKRCATCDLSWSALNEFLNAPSTAAVPAIENVRHYDLSRVSDVAFTFTDATLMDDGCCVLFVASAEGSPNAIDDGAVLGTALGVIADDGNARMCMLVDERGRLVTDKAEGIALSRKDANRAYIVFDPDDHHVPATLAEVDLSGFR